MAFAHNFYKKNMAFAHDKVL